MESVSYGIYGDVYIHTYPVGVIQGKEFVQKDLDDPVVKINISGIFFWLKNNLK